MKHIETCPCGIAKVDCDYHKPAASEREKPEPEGFQQELNALLHQVAKSWHVIDGVIDGSFRWWPWVEPESTEDEEPEVDEYEDENPGT